MTKSRHPFVIIMAATGAQNYPVTALIGGPRDASGAGVWKGEEGLGQSKKASAAFQPALKGPMGPKEDPCPATCVSTNPLDQPLPWSHPTLMAEGVARWGLVFGASVFLKFPGDTLLHGDG